MMENIKYIENIKMEQKLREGQESQCLLMGERERESAREKYKGKNGLSRIW